MPVLRPVEGAAHEMHGAKFIPLASPRRGTRESSVWRVVLSATAPATPHEVTREEIFLVLAGRAAVTLAGEKSEASAGDVIVVPPNTPFEIAAVGEVPFEALVYLPVGGQARLRDGATFTPPWAE
jgi:mannose-6-phosphate isomerase-like protein (cupin superfamily)